MKCMLFLNIMIWVRFLVIICSMYDKGENFEDLCCFVVFKVCWGFRCLGIEIYFVLVFRVFGLVYYSFVDRILVVVMIFVIVIECKVFRVSVIV